MSTHPVDMYMIQCDHYEGSKRCLELFDEEGDVLAWETPETARIVANESGWRCDADGDFCPVHWDYEEAGDD